MKTITFGCRLNIYESEIIKNTLKQANINDLVVVNSCAVTQEAERQVLQAIRKEKKANPNAKIVVTGCAAQISPGKFSNMPEVHKVVGNIDKFEAENYISNDKVLVTDIMKIKETANHMVTDFENNTRAFLEIQNGCNHRCTFCIIPFGRGNNRSVPVGNIIEQVKKIVDQDFKEVIFTGVDITDYGVNLPAQPKLGQLVKRLFNLVPNLPRLRLSSVDVAEIDDTLLDLIVNEPRLMPHLHISLQAGDNMILKRMKRRHNREQVLDFVEYVKNRRPDIAFGADIIAGFPTETDEMFRNSYDLIKDTKISHLHVFPFSPREGTPAARIPQIDRKIIKDRAAELRKLGAKNLTNFYHSQLQKTHNILVEKNNKGLTENFLKVRFEQNVPSGKIISAKATKFQDNALIVEKI